MCGPAAHRSTGQELAHSRQCGLEVPDRRVAAGVPARILEKPVSDDFVREWTEFKKVYSDLARRYPEGLGPPL